MKINPITNSNVSFKYKNVLKTEWLKGNLPTVIHDFYDGSLLSKDTITLEHLKPHSKGGATTLTNLVLTNKFCNQARGNQDIRKFINPENARKYLEECKEIDLPNLKGLAYVEGILKTLKKLGVDLTK